MNEEKRILKEKKKEYKKIGEIVENLDRVCIEGGYVILRFL